MDRHKGFLPVRVGKKPLRRSIQKKFVMNAKKRFTNNNQLLHAYTNKQKATDRNE
jgi:hypothetical protein